MLLACSNSIWTFLQETNDATGISLEQFFRGKA
jgi:hypothetical protein